MPTYSLTLSDACVARLQEIVADYNNAEGTSLTVPQFIRLHLRELAIDRELSFATQQLAHQAQTDANAAILAAKENLLKNV